MGFISRLLGGQSLINVIRPEGIHSVPCCMACGIVILKKSDIGIILKQWDNVPRKRFISVALDIKFPSITTILVRKPCPPRPRQNPHPPKRSRSSTEQRHNVHSMNRKPRLVREKNVIALLSKPALVCTCPINTNYAVTSHRNTNKIWTICT